VIYRIRNKTGYRMTFKVNSGKLFVENGQQVKFDFIPPLSGIILNCRNPYELTVLNETELLDGQTRVLDIGLKEY